MEKNNKKISRNCCKVINQMIEKIPTIEIKLLKELAWNYEDAAFKAPEETIQWERTMETLQNNIGIPTKDWQFEILNIFTTMPIEKLKANF